MGQIVFMLCSTPGIVFGWSREGQTNIHGLMLMKHAGFTASGSSGSNYMQVLFWKVCVFFLSAQLYWCNEQRGIVFCVVAYGWIRAVETGEAQMWLCQTNRHMD